MQKTLSTAKKMIAAGSSIFVFFLAPNPHCASMREAFVYSLPQQAPA
ncbi:hypothetical protein [Pseudomonas aeruginosa]|nr:hypothetical protein [Pseudomonas aeruginosa]MBG5781613.1 hypothetical protein [Pseudomonas aeruginosa]HBO5818860.1 hypothetical protein [Pseudomonas aeruginosa]HDZ3358766.1 hypothetical protein [Pseudomonas aeruginosa]